MSAIGVLIMAYGTPRSPEGIGPYYTRIRHGRPPTDELLADLTRRYSAIGGLSPLNEVTDAQVDGITTALKKGDEVRLVGFGTFSVAKRKASTGRNPRTGEPMKIKASSAPKFKAGKGLKDAVN